MKQWFRKAALCFALALSVLTLAACGNSSKDTVEPIEPSVKSALEEQAKQYAEQSIYALSDAEIESQIKSAYKTKDEITYNGLTNYLNDKDRLGAFVSVDDAVASKTEDGYSIEINSTFEKRTLKLTLGLNEMTGKTTEMTFEPYYSLAEQMEDAGANLAVGMGTVFVVLIFIAWVISMFKYISVFEKKMKGKKAPAEAPKAAAPAPKAAAPAPAPAAKQDDVMQAVIAAAIAAYEADTAGAQSENGFVPGPTLQNGLFVRPLRSRSFAPAASEAPASAPVVTSVAPAAAPVAAAAPAPAAAPAGVQGSVKVESPMPGKILAVKKSVGDTVKSGDVILILEAMKMENEIVAPQDGTVASINVSVGDSVESGATLATLN